MSLKMNWQIITEAEFVKNVIAAIYILRIIKIIKKTISDLIRIWLILRIWKKVKKWFS